MNVKAPQSLALLKNVQDDIRVACVNAPLRNDESDLEGVLPEAK